MRYFEKQWRCAIEGCGLKWPTYTSIDAYRQHLIKNRIHPNSECQKESSMGNPKDFKGTDAEFKELARQVQADTEAANKHDGPSAESLAEGIE